MNVLDNHLGKMENLGHSPSRYVSEGFADYMKKAFSKVTGYHYNQFRDVTESDTVEHVPQKGGLYPKDLVEEDVSRGELGLELDDIESAEFFTRIAMRENDRWNANYHNQLNGMKKKILDVYLGRISDSIENGRPIEADTTHLPCAMSTVRALEMDESLLQDAKVSIVDGYINYAKSALSHSDHWDWDKYIDFGRSFAESNGIDFNERMVNAGLKTAESVS